MSLSFRSWPMTIILIGPLYLTVLIAGITMIVQAKSQDHVVLGAFMVLFILTLGGMPFLMSWILFRGKKPEKPVL
jgi:hypothetical protein